jgi:hypothetical protein
LVGGVQPAAADIERPEARSDRPGAPAETLPRLDEKGVDAGLSQGACCRDPCRSAADDDDLVVAFLHTSSEDREAKNPRPLPDGLPISAVSATFSAHEVRLMIPFAIIPTPARAALSARPHSLARPLALALLLLSCP